MGYKTKDLDSKDDGYKNKDYKEYRSDPYARYYKTEYGLDSKDSEYEMRSILNGYKNKDYKKNDAYAREYRAPCCAGQELSGGLCYPICASGFSGAGPVCWDGPVFFSNSYGRGAGKFPYSSC